VKYRGKAHEVLSEKKGSIELVEGAKKGKAGYAFEYGAQKKGVKIEHTSGLK